MWPPALHKGVIAFERWDKEETGRNNPDTTEEIEAIASALWISCGLFLSVIA